MNAKNKVVGFLGFAAHCVLTIPIIYCDILRTIVAYVCVEDFRNEYNSLFECIDNAYDWLDEVLKLVYKRYMGTTE